MHTSLVNYTPITQCFCILMLCCSLIQPVSANEPTALADNTRVETLPLREASDARRIIKKNCVLY